MAKKSKRRTAAQERERKRRKRGYYSRHESRFSHARELIGTLERERERKSKGGVFEPFKSGVLPER